MSLVQCWAAHFELVVDCQILVDKLGVRLEQGGVLQTVESPIAAIATDVTPAAAACTAVVDTSMLLLPLLKPLLPLPPPLTTPLKYPMPLPP